MSASTIAMSGETVLIREIVSGRRDLFPELLRPHLPALMRLVRAKMKNDQACDDVLQETVLKAFVHLNQFQFRSSFRTWVIRIAMNQMLAWRRRTSRLLLWDEPRWPEMRFENHAPSPLERCEQAELGMLVRAAACRLPDKYRVVVRLRDLEGHSVDETAVILHLSLAAVKSRHHRARLKMKRLLAPAFCSNPQGARPSPACGELCKVRTDVKMGT